MTRNIIHVDMDAFYASVEQRDNPELKGKPVIIGGRSISRGVVSTCSYEARKFGVHSAMPLVQAYKLCPSGIFLEGDHAKYYQTSKKIMEILNRFTPLVEALSLDEAFLDVTGSLELFGTVEEIGWQIKKIIKEEVGLTASIGISTNKFLAKLASDWKKPDGYMVFSQEQVHEILHPLPIKELWGIGAKTSNKLNQLGIMTVKDIINCSDEWLNRHLGKNGVQIKRLASGKDERPVIPNEEPKSIGHEITFNEDTIDKERLVSKLLALSEAVAIRLRKTGKIGRTISIKLRWSDFSTISRSLTLSVGTDDDVTIYQIALKLFNESYDSKHYVRLIGITVSNFVTEVEVEQLCFFDESEVKKNDLNITLDNLRNRYGKQIITRARLIKKNSGNKR